jgi:urease accessory protein
VVTSQLALLHLCDSLFPIGGFAHSDGLESATSDGRVARPGDLGAWLDAILEETLGRMEGPALWQAWAMFDTGDLDALVTLDEELAALRPSSSARRSSRAMGLRLLTTWQTLRPDPRLAHVLTLAGARRLGPALPIAFAGACACAGVDRRHSIEAFAYTRLAATVSAAMRLMPIGQTDAHLLLARTLDRVPAIADAIVRRDARLESFTPAIDIAVMSQQYVHSRLFRS